MEENSPAVGARVDRGVRRVSRWPRRYECFRHQHSRCGSAKLADLDWSRWFSDSTGGGLYLHVWHQDGETIHRVTCAYSARPRLESVDGVLFWLVDAPNV